MPRCLDALMPPGLHHQNELLQQSIEHVIEIPTCANLKVCRKKGVSEHRANTWHWIVAYILCATCPSKRSTGGEEVPLVVVVDLILYQQRRHLVPTTACTSTRCSPYNFKFSSHFSDRFPRCGTKLQHHHRTFKPRRSTLHCFTQMVQC